MRRKNKRHETKASPEKSPEKPSRRSSRHSRRRRKSSSSSEKEEDSKAAAAAAAAVSVAVKEVVVPKPAGGSPSPEQASEVIGKNTSMGHIEEPSSSKKHSSGALEEDKLVVKSADNAEKEWKEDKGFWEGGNEKPAEATSENKEKGDGGVWKVQSANGAGGEIQKLKICRSFLSKEISSPKRKSGRSHRDSSQKGTEESSDCDEHSQSEGSESKTRHRTRTRTVSQSSPTVQDSQKVVCDVSEEKPTKIKIHIGSRSPEKTPSVDPPTSESDVTVAMVEQVVEEEVVVASEEVEMNDIVEQKEEVAVEVSQDVDQGGDKNTEDSSQKVNNEIVIGAESIQNIELPSDEPVEKVQSLTSSPRPEKEQPANSDDNTTEGSDSGSNSDDSNMKKKKRRRKGGMMSTVSRQKPSAEKDQSHGRESGKEEPEEDRMTLKEDVVRGTVEEQQRDHQDSVKESPSVSVDKENVAESSRASPGPSEPVAKKRRWGASKSIRPAKKPVLCISTDSLKNLIPEAKPVPIEEVRLSVEEEGEHIEDMEEDQPDEKKEVFKEVTKKKDKDRKKEKDRLKEKPETEVKIEADVKLERPSTDGMKVNRRICVLSEDDRKLARSPSPPRHRPSDVLFITNLVRPFTIPQLKNLLARTGKIAENGFWIDKIKSKCYVQYSDVEEAIETRHALHGVRWPVSNPRTLCVEFAAYDDMAVAQALNEEADLPRKTEPLQMDHSVEGWIADQARLNLDRPQRRVREWDVGKPAHPDEALDLLQTERPDFEELRDRERRNKREKGRRSRTPDAHEPLARKLRRKDEDAPAKLLDDLFRKTKVHPCIYWLPLTAEQIVVKEEMRRQHMAEHERRIAEMKKAELSRRDRERRPRK